MFCLHNYNLQYSIHHLEAPPTMAIFNGIDYNLEYRSEEDDAWYTCGVLLEDANNLRVKFKDFIQSYFDEVFSTEDISTHCEIQKLLNRFRPVSEPVEDNECSRVVEGMLVCAIYRGDEEVLYYDAVVDAVRHKEHTPEKCLCSYLLFWQHGPGKGNITASTLDDICLITHGALHPKIIDFANLVKEKLKTSSNENPTKSQAFGSVSSLIGREILCPELSDHDTDLGGVKKSDIHHYIVLENLDKDLCPLLMMDFIHEHTSITAQTYVFPSLLAETYTRGAIMTDSSTKLKRIYDFINNPNHFITSFSGRPWVIAEENLKIGTINTNLQSLQPKYQNYSTKNELKFVRLGTEGYRKSKQLKEVYLEFRNHLNGLMQRLAMEEKNQGPFSFGQL